LAFSNGLNRGFKELKCYDNSIRGIADSFAVRLASLDLRISPALGD
jgi:hypothetical protein